MQHCFLVRIKSIILFTSVFIVPSIRFSWIVLRIYQFYRIGQLHRFIIFYRLIHRPDEMFSAFLIRRIVFHLKTILSCIHVFISKINGISIFPFRNLPAANGQTVDAL